MIRAVFLDRDDTLVECRSLAPAPPPARVGDLYEPHRVRLLPGVLGALGALKGAGFLLIVVSNQGLVARGAAGLRQVFATNAALFALTPDAAPRGWAYRSTSVIDAVYVCPFHPEGVVPSYAREHPWRKPGEGMIAQAALDFDLDLSGCWLVGDAQRDVDAGVRAGLAPARCLRVGPGQELAGLPEAAAVILACENQM